MLLSPRWRESGDHRPFRLIRNYAASTRPYCQSIDILKGQRTENGILCRLHSHYSCCRISGVRFESVN